MNVIGMKIANMPIPSHTIFTCKTNWKHLAVHAWKSGSVGIHGGAKVATSWDSMCQPLQGHPWELHVRLLTGDWLHGVSQKGLLSIGQNLNPKFHQTLGEFCWSLARDLSHIQSTHVTNMLEHASSILPLESWHILAVLEGFGGGHLEGLVELAVAVGARNETRFDLFHHQLAILVAIHHLAAGSGRSGRSRGKDGGKDGRTNPSHMKAKFGEIKSALDQNQTTCSQPWWATASIPLMRLGTCVENGRVLSDHWRSLCRSVFFSHPLSFLWHQRSDILMVLSFLIHILTQWKTDNVQNHRASLKKHMETEKGNDNNNSNMSTKSASISLMACTGVGFIYPSIYPIETCHGRLGKRPWPMYGW